MMVKVEASVVVKAPRKKVYEWFGNPENWARYEGAVWKSVKVTKKGPQEATAMQEGIIGRKPARGKFKYTYSPPSKIESVWLEGNCGGIEINEQPIKWSFAEVPGGTKVFGSIPVPIPCITKVFGSDGEKKLEGIMLRELKKIGATLEKC